MHRILAKVLWFAATTD